MHLPRVVYKSAMSPLEACLPEKNAPTITDDALAWQIYHPALLQTPRVARVWAFWLLWMLLVAVILMVYLPWQQNVYGSGEVIAFSPLERSQAIEAPINGRINRWYVSEGAKVKKGELIAVMADNDPEYLLRLQQQRQALVNEQGFAESKALAYELGVQNYQAAVVQTSAAAKAKVESALAKRAAAAEDLTSDQASLEANLLNLERERSLQAEGLSSKRALELADMAYQKSLADVAKDRAKLSEAESEIRVARAELGKAEASAKSSLNSAQAALEDSRGSIEKLRADISKLDTQLARQATQEIRAPIAGTILNLSTFADTVYAKAGDPLATLVPDTRERAVELYMKGLDIPLIRPGREVRLQFEGWPALQFSGWPSVAVGTFGGKVTLVDATDDGKGNFRIVVRPNEPWPEAAYLRQGVRARGWVLLDTVPLGYELWRQFNGFPAQLAESPAKTEDTNLIKRKSKK